jgi:hypothetical protein
MCKRTDCGGQCDLRIRCAARLALHHSTSRTAYKSCSLHALSRASPLTRSCSCLDRPVFTVASRLATKDNEGGARYASREATVLNGLFQTGRQSRASSVVDNTTMRSFDRQTDRCRLCRCKKLVLLSWSRTSPLQTSLPPSSPPPVCSSRGLNPR